jgi:hypothetical protein
MDIQRRDACSSEEELPGVVRYRGAQPFDELDLPPEPADVAEDYDWAMKDPQVRQAYGGLAVAVPRHKVWGAGKSLRAAWEQARQAPDCPPINELVFVVVPGVAPEARAGDN